MISQRSRLSGPVLCVAALLSTAGLPLTLVAQQAADPASTGAGTTNPDANTTAATRPGNAQLLDDFAHFVLTANYAMATSVGQELLSRGLTTAEFASLVEAGNLDRFQGAAQRALRVPGNDLLQQTAGAMLTQFEAGLLARARDPQQIKRNIESLTGSLRARLIARQGLVQAGEYAMPQLLEAFLQEQSPELSVQAQSVMIDLGRQAIAPLTATLRQMPATQQERVVRVLGLIPYRQSLPFLADLRDSAETSAVRQAASEALTRLNAQSLDAATLYRELAEAYYDQKSEVTSFPGETHQLLWNFSAATGLTMNAIRTEVFHEAIAMRLLERAMQLETGGSSGLNPDTLALWVASNYRRELDTPAEYTNPAYPTTADAARAAGVPARRGAEYFGIAAGSDIAQRVLARALRDRATPLSLRALSAVEQTAGAGIGLSAPSGRSPLVEALTYPNRRVQIGAALAIAAANPRSGFAGAERVVPTLASAVIADATPSAIILTPDVELYQSLRSVLQDAGYAVLPQGQSLSQIESAIVEAPSIDLVITAGFASDRTADLVESARGSSRTEAAPVLVLTSPEVYAQQARRFETDRTIALRPLGTSADGLRSTIESLVTSASGGPISTEEAQSLAQASLNALTNLAVSGTQVLSVADAAGPLTSALESTKDAQSKMGIAMVLSYIGQDRVQRALLDTALASEEPARAGLFMALADSAKRFGNLLEPRQITELSRIASSDNEQEAVRAAAILSALNVPNDRLLPMILGQ